MTRMNMSELRCLNSRMEMKPKLVDQGGAGQPHLRCRKFRESPVILNPRAGVPVLTDVEEN